MKHQSDAYLHDKDNGNTERHAGKNTHSTVESLLDRMHHQGDFPAFSKHVMEINQKASLTGNTTASELANVILQDYSLTSKLLRVVNSALYGQFEGSVTTVSHAVVILGFERVRLAPLSLSLFEHFQNRSNAVELKDEVIRAFMSGIIAKDLAPDLGMKDTEVAFISSMFHNLGKCLTICYLPEEYREIHRLMAQGDLSLEKASRSVLGISFAELGLGVAHAWKFPRKIICSMQGLPDSKIDKPSNDEDLLRSLSNFSNELCQIINNSTAKNISEALQTLTSRFENCLGISDSQVTDLMHSAIKKVGTYSRILNIPMEQSHFIKRLTHLSRLYDLTKTANSHEDRLQEITQPPDTTRVMTADDQDEGVDSVGIDGRKNVLIQGIREITNTLQGSYQLNDVLTMILETIYRGFGFSRVLLCVISMDRRMMTGRFGFGKDIDEIIPTFRYRINDRSSDVFNLALSQGQDIGFDKATDDTIRTRIPDWYRRKISAPSFFLYPILFENIPFALLYADMEKAGETLPKDQMHYIKTLRNQAILAIKQKRSS